jgi:ComF family protein
MDLFYYLKKTAHFLFPSTCIFCGEVTPLFHDFCLSCFTELPMLSHGCLRCRKPFPGITTTLTCGECLTHPPPFDQTYALYFYEPPITQLLLRLKFNHQLLYARVLGEQMASAIQHTWYAGKRLPDVMLPVPLHIHRLRERGFNQAIEIAKPIAKALKIPLDTQSALRIKPTKAQATLPAKARSFNVHGAFHLRQSFQHQHVAVIDDVITTGHTITEFCKIIRQSNPKQIDVWCVARPIPTAFQHV